MNEEFLSSLGLEEDISRRILAEYAAEKLEGSVARELEGAGVCDKSAAEKLLDREGLSADNVSERVAVLKREHPTLFKSSLPQIVSSAEPATVAKNDFDKMGYKERLELFRKNPDVYKKLVR